MMSYPNPTTSSTDRAVLLDILERSGLFAGLDLPQLASLADRMDLVTFHKGDVIGAEGAIANHLFVLVEGSADMLKRIKADDPTSESVLLLTLGKGQYIGESPLLEGVPFSATLVAAAEPTRALRLAHDAFRVLVRSNPVIAESLLRGLSSELRAFRRVLAATLWAPAKATRRDSLTHILDSDAPTTAPAKKAPQVVRMAVFDFMKHEKASFEAAVDRFRTDTPEFADGSHVLEVAYFEAKLDASTVMLAAGSHAVCVFVNDTVSAEVLTMLSTQGVRLIALRCAGFDRVDLKAAAALGIAVARVPAYSPYAVAEFATTLAMTLNRKVVTAAGRVRQGNFALHGLVGFDMYGKTVGVVGTGKIGQCFIKIMQGFGCRILCYDAYPSAQVASWPGCSYVTLDELLAQSKLISLHCPLLPETRHMINAETLAKTQRGVVLINTSRGALVDTRALIDALKSGHVAGAGLDVYENEQSLFFEDHSAEAVPDDAYSRLLSFPNVIATGHQAFLTEEALDKIAEVTLENLLEAVVRKVPTAKLANGVSA
ncbi:hypothetical protein HK405_005500 [Cladochytrium tenue]|nr:hypothetical protein HK405_005500 [Cladochytrium tenue]